MNINQKVEALRQKMKANSVDAYIIPTSDPHQSEYPATHWQSRAWISGFTGSAGTVIVTQDHAGLWTDSRYFLQAEEEISDSSFELHKMHNQFKPGYITWVKEQLAEGSTVSIDGALFSLNQKNEFESILSSKKISLSIQEDFIDGVWTDRPPIPVKKIFEHPVEFAGKSRAEKLSEIRSEMQKSGASVHLMTTHDDIGWTYNLRGYDVEFNPVFVAYSIINDEDAILFINDIKVPHDIKSNLENDQIYLKPYSEIYSYLNDLSADTKILIDESSINFKLYESIKHLQLISGEIIARHLKAIKNDVEIAHFKRVMEKDGVALAEAFYWLENTVEERAVSEFEFSNKLAECRSRQENYYGESFGAIIGYRGNGAIIHYRPQEASSANILNEGILLADSGGQYHDGTTDITRTVSFDEASAEEKKAYTLVLKGHIGLAMAIFPEGTNGGQLDILARQHLWNNGMNYLHGTGHGVGFFMNVHEPPQGFAPGASMRAKTIHKSGMVSSNEPGFYKEGAYGIRIENLVVARKSERNGFLEFDTITLFPMETSLIELSLLNEIEKKWLNEYHEEVYNKLNPALNNEMKVWLRNKCASV